MDKILCHDMHLRDQNAYHLISFRTIGSQQIPNTIPLTDVSYLCAFLYNFSLL